MPPNGAHARADCSEIVVFVMPVDAKDEAAEASLPYQKAAYPFLAPGNRPAFLKRAVQSSLKREQFSCDLFGTNRRYAMSSSQQ